MGISNTAFLFYRGPGEDFSDERKLIETVSVGHGDQELVFIIKGPVHALDAVRINLIPPIAANVSVAYLKLYGICATIYFNGMDNNKDLLINLRNADELQQHATLNGLTLNKKILGELYAVSATDPTIALTFAPVISVNPAEKMEVRVSLEYLFGDDYLLARDLFLVNQERLEQKVRALDVEIRQMQAEKEAFNAYQHSPMWKGFVHLHHAYTKLTTTGVLKAFSRLFQPSYWSKRNQTDYERWRTSNGYEKGKHRDG